MVAPTCLALPLYQGFSQIVTQKVHRLLYHSLCTDVAAGEGFGPPCGDAKNRSGLRRSSGFSTAAEKARLLHPPPAAQPRFSNDLRVITSRRLAVPEKCCGLTLARLAAIAVPGPASRRPANGAAAEIAAPLLLPLAARCRFIPTSSARRPHNPVSAGATHFRNSKKHSPPEGWTVFFVVAGEGFEPTTSGL